MGDGIFIGVDIGSLTAKAVVLDHTTLQAAHIMRVRPRPVDSAVAVVEAVLNTVGARMSDINNCCATGYGRLEIPFATMQMSEIACHARGAYHANPSIRTVIDIGGQDCKVIALNEMGMVSDFIMNDKCAAGTGRCLEILAQAIGVGLDELGPLGLKSGKPVAVTNKCSIFMELEVLQHVYRKIKLKDIAAGINLSAARRVEALTKAVPLRPSYCLTGGVSKNAGVAGALQRLMGMRFTPLTQDPQIIGALGAAIFAREAV